MAKSAVQKEQMMKEQDAQRILDEVRPTNEWHAGSTAYINQVGDLLVVSYRGVVKRVKGTAVQKLAALEQHSGSKLRSVA